MATALGVEAVKAGKSVYFTTLADLIAALSRAEREGRLQERIRFFTSETHRPWRESLRQYVRDLPTTTADAAPVPSAKLHVP